MAVEPEAGELKKLTDRNAELEKEVKELRAAAAAGARAVEVKCPACESTILSDGSKLVKKNREFAALEVLADEVQETRKRIQELQTENAQLKGGNAPAPGTTRKSSGFAVLSR